MASQDAVSIEIADTQIAENSQAAEAVATQAYTESQVAAKAPNGDGQPAASVEELPEAGQAANPDGQGGTASKGDGEPEPPAEEAFQDAQTPQQTQMVQDEEEPCEERALQRQNAFLEETAMVKCKKCGVDADVTECVCRGPREMWCRSCNAIYTMLQRNMQWPPKEFEQLDEDRQQGFFQKVAQEKEASKSSCFSYRRVRESLTKSLLEEQIRQRKIDVGGTYLPKSVYEKKGYILDSEWEDRTPRMWSDNLRQWTYLVVEVTIKESELKQTIERSLLECERAVKKRKHPKVTAEEAEAVETKSQKTDMVPIMDLVTDSEGESKKAKGEDKPKVLTGKKLEKHLQREAAKAQREEEAAKKKAAAAEKKKAKETSKKTLQTATKVAGPLNQNCKTMYDLVGKAKDFGLTNSGDSKKLLEEIEMLDQMRKDCWSALGYYTKNPNCELAALAFTLEEANQKIKDCQALAKNVRKDIAETKKAVAEAKKAQS
eukprot:s1274_g16.t1